MADSTQTVSVGDGGGVRLTAVILAFAAIYVIWGSTYLAIRFAIETMPPFGMAAVRFLVAGALMYVWLRARGGLAPTLVQWRSGAISGTLLLVGGNGAVVVAEQWVPSGLVALIVGAVLQKEILERKYDDGPEYLALELPMYQEKELNHLY